MFVSARKSVLRWRMASQRKGHVAVRRISTTRYVAIPEQQLTNSQGIWSWYDADVAYYCPASSLNRGTVNLPVPLKNLVPYPGPESNVNQVDEEVDKTVGGAKSPGNSQRPNDNAFGFFILSGPKNEITTLNLWDGSHWILYNCPTEATEERHTVQAVCADTSVLSNCHAIFEDSVEATVVEMPENCGPGRYAMAVSLHCSMNHTQLPKRLQKRSGIDPLIYDFTFDYDFTVVNKRASSNVLMRIDYSDDVGYWDKIVGKRNQRWRVNPFLTQRTTAPPSTQKKRDLEVKTEHGGDYKKWVEHSWHKEKRSMDLAELHKRWFSSDIREWFSKQRDIDLTLTGVNPHASDSFGWYLFKESLNCKAYGIDQMYFESYADMNYDIRASAGLTFMSFGSPFRVPGIVTIGPNFKLIGQILGEAVLHFQTTYTVDLAKWDFSQRYPAPSGGVPTKEEDKPTEPFSWDLDVNGEIVTHIIPKVTLSVVFDSSKVANAAIDLGVDAYARVYGTTKVGSKQDFVYYYGVDGGATLYAEVEAPTPFGVSLRNYYPLIPRKFTIIPKTCGDGSMARKRATIDLNDFPIMSG
ncbi:hypothetical protein B0J14DRAFT_565139 [Halenospora varia]|nr:hypothetical protein B0J14DRAFT_565139 [Halenospora varia]